MDLTNLNASDFSSSNLGNLLTEIDNALTNGEYSKVKMVISQINNFLVNQGMITVESNGRNIISLPGGETVDVGAISYEITKRMNANINTVTTSDPERDNAVAEMDKYLTSIFNQQNLTMELVNRGFSISDFEDAIKKANENSRKHIDELKGYRQDKVKVFDDFLGKDVVINSGNYISKSYDTIIEQCEEAITRFSVAKKQIDQLEQLRNSRATETDATKQASLDDQIKRVENNLNYLADGIKNMKINGIDESILENLATNPNANAMIKVESYKVKKEMASTYDKIALKIPTLTDIQKNELGISQQVEEAFSKLHDPDRNIKMQAMRDARKYIKTASIDKNEDIAAEIRREEQLIEIRNKNIESYKEIDKRANTVINKVMPKTEYVQEVDPNTGDPVFEEVDDGNGNLVQAPKYVQKHDSNGQPIVDSNGNPVYEEQYILRPKRARDAEGNYIRNPDIEGGYELVQATDPNTGDPLVDSNTGEPIYEKESVLEIDESQRDYYLQKGFDEAKALKSIDSYTRKEKRRILAQLGKGNAFTRLFATNKLWKKHNVRNNMLRHRQNKFIELEARKEYEVLIDDINILDQLEAKRNRIIGSAEVQHQLYNAGKDQGRNVSSVDKSQVINDLSNAAYEEALYRSATQGRDEMRNIRIAQNDSYRRAVQRHIKNSQIQHNDGINHNDKDNDLEL